MKKIISMFALVGLFVVVLPSTIKAEVPQDENCHNVLFICDGEPTAYAVVCGLEDILFFTENICG
ncbi:MAG: hypothetical protein JW857_10500 [Bacteroidales bacterium]|nr:hypothetical protein [Bacteroidales bacterium]